MKKISGIAKKWKPFILGFLISYLVYSLTNDFGDIGRGLKDGWNSIQMQEKEPSKNQ
jgi:hypothetical protein